MTRVSRHSWSIALRTGCTLCLIGFAFGLVAISCAASEAGSKTAVPIYKSILSDKAAYHGPERDQPEPSDIEEVRVGFFGPSQSSNAMGQNMWRGATLAVEKANAAGGYRGKRFRLVCRWADNPWGAGSKEMTRLVYEDKVWTVIGSIDGATTHIAEQIAVKARITLISPLSGDSSLTHTAVPWMFRMPPDDAAVAEFLVRLAIEKNGFRRIAVLSSADHDGRAGAAEVVSALGRRQVRPVVHLTFDRSQTDFSPQIGRISSASAEAIFLWGEPDSSARLLRSLRGKGISLPVFGPPVFSLPSFLEKAGSAADGLMTCRLAWGNDETRSTEFARDFEERFGEKPSDDAAVAYDAATIVIEAVRKAGLNRARIRDAVSEMSGFVGIAGKITWDNGGGNVAVPQSVALHRGWLCAIEE